MNSFDQTLNLALHPYTFISRMRAKENLDVFETRINFQKTICMAGEEAAKVFYDKSRFTRVDAAPANLRSTLMGKGAVHTLDGKAHLIRKQMFMSLMTPDSIQSLVATTEDIWRQSLPAWTQKKRLILFDEMSLLLCKAVCSWAKVPLDNPSQRTAECNAMISGGGGGLVRYLKGLSGRKSSEAWIASHIRKIRKEPEKAAGENASELIAFHRDADGQLLSDEVAAVEMINIIRPVVAVSRFIAYTALALEQFPKMRPSTDQEKSDFVLEVRRYYPFFPFVAARVREDFSWRGFEFKAGRRTLLDLYGTNHDRRSWSEPERFDPSRFRDRTISAYAFVPQGGDDPSTNHRCPGENIANSLMRLSLEMFLREFRYEVPKQDLSLNMATAPTGPKSGFLIQNVKYP